MKPLAPRYPLMFVSALVALTLCGCAGMQVSRPYTLDEARQSELEGFRNLQPVNKQQMCAAYSDGRLNTRQLAQDGYPILVREAKNNGTALAFNESDYESLLVQIVAQVCNE